MFFYAARKFEVRFDLYRRAIVVDCQTTVSIALEYPHTFGAHTEARDVLLE